MDEDIPSLILYWFQLVFQSVGRETHGFDGGDDHVGIVFLHQQLLRVSFVPSLKREKARSGIRGDKR